MQSRQTFKNGPYLIPRFSLRQSIYKITIQKYYFIRRLILAHLIRRRALLLLRPLLGYQPVLSMYSYLSYLSYLPISRAKTNINHAFPPELHPILLQPPGPAYLPSPPLRTYAKRNPSHSRQPPRVLHRVATQLRTIRAREEKHYHSMFRARARNCCTGASERVGIRSCV